MSSPTTSTMVASSTKSSGGDSAAAGLTSGGVGTKLTADAATW